MKISAATYLRWDRLWINLEILFKVRVHQEFLATTHSHPNLLLILGMTRLLILVFDAATLVNVSKRVFLGNNRQNICVLLLTQTLR